MQVFKDFGEGNFQKCLTVTSVHWNPWKVCCFTTLYHSGEYFSGYCWIFVYVILPADLGLNYSRCVFEVSAAWDMEEELAHSKVLLKCAHHHNGLLSTLQTNMQTLNRLLHLPWTNVAAVWKHTAAVCDPWEKEVQNAFSFVFPGHLWQAALNYPCCAVIVTQKLITFPVQKCSKTLLTIMSTTCVYVRHCNISNLLKFLAVLMIKVDQLLSH